MRSTILGLVAVASLAAVACESITVDPAKVVPAPDYTEAAVTAVAGFYKMPRYPVVYDGVSKICADGYGRRDESGCHIYGLPVIYFYGGAALDCAGGGGFTEYGECMTGVTAGDGALSIVELPPEGYTLGTDTVENKSILAHEMGHEASVQRGEGDCDDHDCHWFAPGGEVEKATELLVSLGM